jgi:alkyl sulfatase BDS1-like metallo-beta-lactamase superfamily hydrolase
MTDGTGTDRKPASDATRRAQRRVAEVLDLDQPDDPGRARRGLVARPSGPVMSAMGFPVWDVADYDFVQGDAPDTVNPSLWRQAKLNGEAGLFEVAEGCWQVRGLDISNLTFIAGDTGWIVIDPLTASETAAAALALANEHLGERPVKAVIYTHSHIDHYAGVRGVVSDEQVSSGEVEIVAPEGFMVAAVAENVIAGPVMRRRATYMYGMLLPKDADGHVDSGLGKGIPLLPDQGLLAPTDLITATGEARVLDGVRIEFQLTPGTEAPAEMNFFFPERRWLCMAENCSSNLHNVYTPRGAVVRDALAWSTYLQESIDRFADRAEVLFISHHWPRWGSADIRQFLEVQRDVYRWIHDQTMRLANHGHTAVEIAEQLDLPPSLAGEFSVRGYYGTVNHNVKAVYQRYLGWFDANPANLHPLPPVDESQRYVTAMGGAERVLELLRVALDEGDLRWAATLGNHLVFAHPELDAGRELQADVLEQLGYQAESGPWRDFYLTGAQELRTGPAPIGAGVSADADTAAAMTPEMLLHLLGVRLDGPRADGRELTLELQVTDRGETWRIGLLHGALHHSPTPAPEAQVRVAVEHLVLARLVAGAVTLGDLEAAGEIVVDGDRDALVDLLGLLDTFDLGFPIVTP